MRDSIVDSSAADPDGAKQRSKLGISDWALPKLGYHDWVFPGEPWPDFCLCLKCGFYDTTVKYDPCPISDVDEDI